MKTESPAHGHITENGTGIGSVTPEMVRQRASELAVIQTPSLPDSDPQSNDALKK